MTGFLARKTLAGKLEPVDDAGCEALAGLAVGSIVRVEMKRPRNLAHHRKYWALVSLIYENQTHYPSPETLSDAIKVLAGHCTVVRLKDGREVYIPKSISFYAMDQNEFDRFWDSVVKVCCEKIIPGLKRTDLERELLELCA